jgi:hypothetical protein
MVLTEAVKQKLIAPPQASAEVEATFPMVAITKWYGPQEQWMCDNAFAQLGKDGARALIVKRGDSTAIYRPSNEVTLTAEE